MSDGENDGPIRNGGREMVGNDGKVYEVRDGHVEDNVPNPRDTVGLEPAAGYMGGGAGGIATSASTTGLGESEQGQEERVTTESGPHGAVAESADLGQRPLRDYKREGEPSFDTTSTTMSASHGSVTTTGGMGSDTTPSATTVGMGSDSMSLDNDNTSPLGDVSSTETLTNVREGMKVVDSSGDEIGKVRSLKSGDTSSSTIDDAGDMAEDVGVIAVPGGTGTGGSSGIGAGSGIPGIIGTTAGGGDEPNVPEPAYSRLTRVGFIKIDSKGFFASDRYAGADQIDRIDGDTVYLTATKDDLIS